MQDSFTNLMFYLLEGTRGGETRTRILDALFKRPMNKNQLAKTVKLDYKTVEHHLKLLVENDFLSIIKKGSYGAVYLPSQTLRSSKKEFDEIKERFG